MKVTVLALVLIATAGLSAQELSPDINFLSGMPFDSSYFNHEFTFSFGRITGKPYSAEETTRSVRVLGDGNRIVNSSVIRIFRDDQGRVRREVTLTRGGSEGKRTVITISDPVAGVSYSLDPRTKVARKSTAFPHLEHTMQELNDRIQKSIHVNTKDLLDGKAFHFEFPEVNITPDFEAGRNAPVPRGKGVTRTHEDLGTDTIAGIEAEGTRDVTTIPAGIIGNEKPIVIKSERWVAKDLGIDVKTIHEDPRFGTTEFTISELKRTEPSAALFQVPPGYRVEGGEGLALAK